MNINDGNIIRELTRLWDEAKPGRDAAALHDARRIIRDLRASQFRWIPVSERLPKQSDANTRGEVFILYPGGTACDCPWDRLSQPSLVAWEPYNATHWAPIPPLPEQTQAQKDEELFEKNYGIGYGNLQPAIRAAFLQGLKVARASRSAP